MHETKGVRHCALSIDGANDIYPQFALLFPRNKNDTEILLGIKS